MAAGMLKNGPWQPLKQQSTLKFGGRQGISKNIALIMLIVVLAAISRNTGIFYTIASHQKWPKSGPKRVKKIDFCNIILSYDVFLL